MISSILATTVVAIAYGDYTGFADVHKMPIPRSDMSVSVHEAAEGTRMYLVGGCSQDQVCYNPASHFDCYCGGITNKTQFYTPVLDRFETFPADAPRARYRHAAAIADGTIYLFGGRDIADDVIIEVDAYNIKTNTWSTPCTWNGATSDNAAFVEGGEIFLTGGWTPEYNANNQTLRFDPATCALTPLAEMANARGDAIAVSVNTTNGTEFHFVVGGFAKDICNGENVVESYNVSSNKWTQHKDLALGRADMALGVIDSHVFAIGGETVNSGCNRSIAQTDVERLDAGNTTHPFSGDWVVEESVPNNRFRYVGVSYGRTIYLFGGQSAWVENIDGNGNGGFPVSDTTMIYRPASVTDSPTKSTASPVAAPTIDNGNSAASDPRVLSFITTMFMTLVSTFMMIVFA